VGRTACTQPQRLYSRAKPLLPLWAVRPVQSLNASTVELYLYPPMGRTACTKPQCLYKGALYLLILIFSIYIYVYIIIYIHISISTCFGRLCAHHQENPLCLCDTWYLLHCVGDCLVCTVERKSSTQNNKYEVSHKYSCFSWWWAHSRPKHVEIDKYAKNEYTRNTRKLCTKLALFTGLYRDARFTKHKIYELSLLFYNYLLTYSMEQSPSWEAILMGPVAQSA
jgi:hypothetical protein